MGYSRAAEAPAQTLKGSVGSVNESQRNNSMGADLAGIGVEVKPVQRFTVRRDQGNNTQIDHLVINKKIVP